METLVTIAIASYNNAPYIERCIESTLQQTYGHLEILIVDDGSKDDTLKKIERFKADDRVKIIIKENGGLSTVRQKALEVATGDYISFIDADDYLKSEYVERMLTKLVRDKSDICICSTIFENENGDELQKTKYRCVDSITPIVPTIKIQSNTKERVTGRLYLSDSWNKMYRMAFLRESGINFCMPKGYNGTDSIFNRLLVLHEPSYSTISYDGYAHVLYEKSAVHRKRKNLLFSYMKIVEQMIAECEKIGIRTEMNDAIATYYIRCLVSACVDVYHDDKNYFRCYKGINHIYCQHKAFSDQNQIPILPMSKIQKVYVKILSFSFLRCRVLMPVALLLFVKLKNIK